MTQEETPVPGVRQPRVRPSIAAALGLYAGYLAIFYTTWAVNGVDYPTIGDSVESTMLHYALPTTFGVLFLLVAVTAMGWWRPVLFEKEKGGPKWVWILPITVVGLGTFSLASIHTDALSAQLLFWSVLGGLGVGIGEEVITRGALVVGLRTRYTEVRVWLYSTLLFSALHIPNVVFGLPLGQMLMQLVFTVIMGSSLYAVRRVSGTLLVPILLHGFWDSAAFLPRATGGEATPFSSLVYPVAIICVIAVLRRDWNRRLA